MANHILDGRELATRPDRMDFRDRSYQPPLVSLPESFPATDEIQAFLKRYYSDGRILNQGREGACTGFGLAAVVNYIIWDRWIRSHNGNPPDGEVQPQLVSPRMVYDTARIYDEWEGEDYSGSSCRGAMKGWHKHGICRQGAWPRDLDADLAGETTWAHDALARPLGAYYRVEARSIADMQAAIHEVRAVYCSARVHEGWTKPTKNVAVQLAGFDLPVIEKHDRISGGHAFAIVGYTPDGFIIQNSWGSSWGFQGFALLTYQDWIENGNDAWVAAMAAPVGIAAQGASPVAMSERPLVETAMANRSLRMGSSGGSVDAWTADKAYLHSIVMGNDGKLLRRLIDAPSIDDLLERVLITEPSRSLDQGAKHIVIFAHGGLNSEAVAINRTRRLGPWFLENGIHPIFLNWRTSVLESISNIGKDITGDFLNERDRLSEGVFGDFFDSAKKKLQNGFDKAFEATAEKVIGKAVWSQMKQNAGLAADGNGGTRAMLLRLRKLRAKYADLKIHLLGHSAGAILLGNLADDFEQQDGIETVGLYAPACSMEFAVRHYGKMLSKGIVGKQKLFIDNLTDKLERDDNVGPYGKSLLYLVGRALEDKRNVPILGMEKSWLLDQNQSLVDPAAISLSGIKGAMRFDFDETHIKFIRDWNKLAHEHQVQATFHAAPQAITSNVNGSVKKIDRTHGSFDNDINLVNASLFRILGTTPAKPIDALVGF